MKVSAFSPSRLAVYQRCPRRYYWQYVVRVPRKRSAKQSVGISLHAALEAITQAGGVTQTGLDGALKLLDAHWEADGFADAATMEAARLAAHATLKAYLEAPAMASVQTVMAEKKLKGAYHDVPLLGIVDRVDRRADGSLELIDYKTGTAADLPGVTQQMAIYRHLVTETTGTRPAHVTIHQLGGHTRSLELSEIAWVAALDKAVSTAQAIESDEMFDARIEPACAHCDYASRCLPYQQS